MRVIAVVLAFLYCGYVSSLIRTCSHFALKQRHTSIVAIPTYSFATVEGLQKEEIEVAPNSLLPPKKDNILERSLIFLLSFLLLRVGGVPELKSMVFPGMTFADFTLFTKNLLFKSDRKILKERIILLLTNIIPQQLREGFKNKFKSDPRWISEKSSEWMSFGFLGWLVGPVERFNIDADLRTTEMVSSDEHDELESKSLSGAKLVECRYLNESGCKATCLYLCKAPTQEFFKSELGLPLYMKPDFATSSCEMHFGVEPPPYEEDPAFQESCFSSCPSKTTGLKKPLC